jgi:hypothetical protein
MLTLEQLISEATALPDTGKAILIDKKAWQECRKLKNASPKLTVAQSKQFLEISPWHKYGNLRRNETCKNTQWLLNSLPSKTSNRISLTA